MYHTEGGSVVVEKAATVGWGGVGVEEVKALSTTTTTTLLPLSLLHSLAGHSVSADDGCWVDLVLDQFLCVLQELSSYDDLYKE